MTYHFEIGTAGSTALTAKTVRNAPSFAAALRLARITDHPQGVAYAARAVRFPAAAVDTQFDRVLKAVK